MSEIPEKPVAWRHTIGERYFQINEPYGRDFEPIFDAAAIDASYRRGLADAERVAREYGNVCNMLWNDNVEPDKNMLARDTAFDIEKIIQSLGKEATPAAAIHAKGE